MFYLLDSRTGVAFSVYLYVSAYYTRRAYLSNLSRTHKNPQSRYYLIKGIKLNNVASYNVLQNVAVFLARNSSFYPVAVIPFALSLPKQLRNFVAVVTAVRAMFEPSICDTYNRFDL